MTETGRAINPAEIRSRLSDEWRVEDGGRGIYGYADEDGTPGLTSSGTVPRSFSIHADGSFWAATWKDAHELRDELCTEADRVRGTKERCIEWVLERAHPTDAQARE